MQNTKRKSRTTAGIKALIAAGAVAATVAGWALLPANDPPSATAAGAVQPGDGSTVQTAPQTGGGFFGNGGSPSGFGRAPRSFTRSHSSR